MPNDESGEKSSLTKSALNRRNVLLGSTTLVAASAIAMQRPIQVAQAQQQPAASREPPNIIFVMGDDVGWLNIGAYHRGIMAGRTPNLDKLASEGMMLCRGELHGRPRQLHHWRTSDPHRVDHRRPGRRHDGNASAGTDHRDRLEIHGLCNWPVRQESFG
jgi:Sulfatase